MSEHLEARGRAGRCRGGGDDRPCRRHDTICEPLDDSLVLYRPGSEYGHILNDSAALIWTSCDGTRSVEDLARVVMARFGIEHERAHADVLACLARLRALGLLVDADAEAAARRDG